MSFLKISVLFLASPRSYGQTGSGKSHTMSGTPSELGIIPCAVDGIFDAITEVGWSRPTTSGPEYPLTRQDTDRAFLLRVSYIEIYNEALRDLLNTKKGPLPDSEKPTIHTAKVCRHPGPHAVF